MSEKKYKCMVCGKEAPPEVVELIKEREKAGDKLEWLLCPECSVRFGDIIRKNPNIAPDELRKLYQ